MKTKLTAAERELLDLIQNGKPFGLSIMRPEGASEVIVTMMRPPFEQSGVVEVGIAPTFAEAWRARRLMNPAVELPTVGSA